MTLEEKQNYLRNEIIEKGYSPDEFANLLIKEKGDNASDLNLWSSEDLQRIVKQFQDSQNMEKLDFQKEEDKKEFKEENKKESKKDNKEESKKEIKEENNEKTKEKNEEEYIESIDEDLWGNKIEPKTKPINCIIKCKKLDPSDLIEKRDKLKVRVTNVEIKKDGIFSSSYNEFTIKNDYLNMDFKRKMDDFVWLKDKLALFYPNIFIPPLPKFKAKKDENYIERKIYYLQNFINYIINNDILLSSDIFQDFISLPIDEFKNTKSTINKMAPPKGIEQIITLDGNINITIIPEIDKKANDINDEIQKKVELFNKLNSSIIETNYIINQLREKCLNLSKIFNELSQFYLKSPIIKNDKNNFNFTKLKGIFSSCAEEYSKKMSYFEIYIRRFFKEIKHELNEFNYLYKKYENARNTFIDVSGRENVSHDDNYKNLQKYFGFTLNIIYDEYQNLNKLHNFRIKEHFSKTSKYLNI